jgi:hypothetical protein
MVKQTCNVTATGSPIIPERIAAMSEADANNYLTMLLQRYEIGYLQVEYQELVEAIFNTERHIKNLERANALGSS